MAAPVGSLVVKIGSDVSQLVIGFDKGKKEAKNFGAAISKTAKVMAGLGLAVGATGLALATKFTKDGLASIDLLTKLGRVVGATQQEMEGLIRAADRVGLSQTEIQATVQRFTKRLGEAAEGSGAAAGALDKLGISAEELIQLPLNESLAIVAERIQEFGTAAERNATAADLFGRKGLALVLTTDNLAESLRLGAKEVKDFGVGVSQIDAEAVETAVDSLGKLTLIFKGVANQMAVILAPAITEVVEGIAAASIESGGFRAALLNAFKVGVEGAFFLQDSIRFVEISLNKVALASLKAQKFLKKFTASSFKELTSLDDQIEGLTDRIDGLVGTPRAELRANEFFSKLEARIEEMQKNLGEVTDGSEVGDALGRLDDTDQEGRLDEIDKFNDLRKEKEFTFQKELTKIQKQGEASRKRFEEMALTDKLASVTGAFASVTAAVANSSKEMFEINKGFQIADAIVNGIAGAIRTWNSVPYPWNIPLTIAHVAGTAAQIANLSSQQFQGGRSGGGGGSAAPTPAAPPSGPGPGGDGGGGAPTTVNIALQGETFDRQSVLGLISGINDAVADGARIRVV